MFCALLLVIGWSSRTAEAAVPSAAPGVASTVNGVLTGYAYGCFPTRIRDDARGPYVDQFTIWVRSAPEKSEIEVDGLHSRWRIAGLSVPLPRVLDALRRLDDSRHLVMARVTGTVRGGKMKAAAISLWRGRLRRKIEPIYNPAPTGSS